MPAFTIIKNDILGRILNLPDKIVIVEIDGELHNSTVTGEQQVLDELNADETYVLGVFNNDFHKIVDGVVVDRSDEELSAPSNMLPSVSPDVLVDGLAIDLKSAGFASISSIPHFSVWTKVDAKSAIDQAAGRARYRIAADGAFVDEEYSLAAKAVQYWRDLGSPPENVPDEIVCWQEAKNIQLSAIGGTLWTIEEAAQDIGYNALAFPFLMAIIRRIRLIGKYTVDTATTDYYFAAQPFISQLDLLVP